MIYCYGRALAIYSEHPPPARMGVLEGLVIVMIVAAGAYVGYHAWQDWLHEPAEAHGVQWPQPGAAAGLLAARPLV